MITTINEWKKFNENFRLNTKNFQVGDMVYVNPYGPKTMNYIDKNGDKISYSKPTNPKLHNFDLNTQYEIVDLSNIYVGLFDDNNQYCEIEYNNLSTTPFKNPNIVNEYFNNNEVEEILNDFMETFNKYNAIKGMGKDVEERALELIQELKDADLRGFLTWIEHGKTLALQELMSKTTYRGNGNTPEQLLDFNAFSLLDTIGMYHREGFIIENKNSNDKWEVYFKVKDYEADLHKNEKELFKGIKIIETGYSSTSYVTMVAYINYNKCKSQKEANDLIKSLYDTFKLR